MTTEQNDFMIKTEFLLDKNPAKRYWTNNLLFLILHQYIFLLFVMFQISCFQEAH